MSNSKKCKNSKSVLIFWVLSVVVELLARRTTVTCTINTLRSQMTALELSVSGATIWRVTLIVTNYDLRDIINIHLCRSSYVYNKGHKLII
jgi:hypothetical protein